MGFVLGNMSAAITVRKITKGGPFDLFGTRGAGECKIWPVQEFSTTDKQGK